MTDKAEHRGWEIETRWRRHHLDDPTYDMAEDELEGQNAFFWWLSALGAVALLAACFWPDIVRLLGEKP